MTRDGQIVRWDAERGFGFIATAAGERNIFFHVRDFRGRLPAAGMAVRFEQIEVGGKGPRAMAVEPLAARSPAAAKAAPRSATPRNSAPRSAPPNSAATAAATARGNGSDRPGRPARPTARQRRPDPAGRSHGQPWWWLAALLLWALLLAAGTLRGLWPAWALALLPLLNALTYALYAGDKHAARQGAWRTPENTLHLLALAGGWPAARWAQQRLRHKSSKPAFQAVYGLTVALNLLALAALLWRGLPVSAWL